MDDNIMPPKEHNTSALKSEDKRLKKCQKQNSKKFIIGLLRSNRKQIPKLKKSTHNMSENFSCEIDIFKKNQKEILDTSGGIPSLNPAIPAWGTTLAPIARARPYDDGAFYAERVILSTLIITIAIVGLAGNAAVLWLLGFRVRRNAFTVYVLNLAGADFLLFSCLLVDNLIFAIEFFHLSTFPLYITNLLIFMTFFPYIVGLSMLSAISTERCLSVLWPIWYRCHRPRHLSAVMCTLLWALSLVLNIFVWKYCLYWSNYFDYFKCMKIHFTMASWLIFLLVVLLGSSLALLLKILCGSRRVPLTRLYVTVLLTVLVFLLCGLPYGFFLFLLIRIKSFNEESVILTYLVMTLLSSVNSCANPIIYFFVGSFRQRQRQPLTEVLQRALQGSPEDQE
ncbi:mas-related G-protein coupled receptor member X4-like [Oryctolagus cuniculus]|uniref:mas-related G-protein coupled receptor member X4-like n=1 Tax=Oryctolagus cuniculus TaxID=9986 RepID=UPI00387939B0